MKKNGFTLVELLAVIVILGITISIVFVKVDNNIKNANEFGNERQRDTIESAALLYVDDNYASLTNLEEKKVDVVTISTLINYGLLSSKDVKNIDGNNLVLIADINGIYKIEYIGTSKSVIFLNGPSDISIYVGDIYTEMGGYIAIPGTGLVELTSSNINSNVNTNVVGDYEITYSYSGVDSVVRKVSVID